MKQLTCLIIQTNAIFLPLPALFQVKIITSLVVAGPLCVEEANLVMFTVWTGWTVGASPIFQPMPTIFLNVLSVLWVEEITLVLAVANAFVNEVETEFEMEFSTASILLAFSLFDPLFTEFGVYALAVLVATFLIVNIVLTDLPASQ